MKEIWEKVHGQPVPICPQIQEEKSVRFRRRKARLREGEREVLTSPFWNSIVVEMIISTSDQTRPSTPNEVSISFPFFYVSSCIPLYFLSCESRGGKGRCVRTSFSSHHLGGWKRLYLIWQIDLLLPCCRDSYRGWLIHDIRLVSTVCYETSPTGRRQGRRGEERREREESGKDSLEFQRSLAVSFWYLLLICSFRSIQERVCRIDDREYILVREFDQKWDVAREGEWGREREREKRTEGGSFAFCYFQGGDYVEYFTVDVLILMSVL